MKPQFLIEFLIILEGRLNFLAGELSPSVSYGQPAVPYVEGRGGEGGCQDVCR